MSIFEIRFGPLIDIIKFSTTQDMRSLNCVNKTIFSVCDSLFIKRLKEGKLKFEEMIFYNDNDYNYITYYVMKTLINTNQINILDVLHPDLIIALFIYSFRNDIFKNDIFTIIPLKSIDMIIKVIGFMVWEYVYLKRKNFHCRTFLMNNEGWRKCFYFDTQVYYTVIISKNNKTANILLEINDTMYGYTICIKKNGFIMKQKNVAKWSVNDIENIIKTIDLYIDQRHFKYINNFLGVLCIDFKKNYPLIECIFEMCNEINRFTNPKIIIGIIINHNIKEIRELLKIKSIKNNIAFTEQSISKKMIIQLSECNLVKIREFIYSKKTYVDDCIIEQIANQTNNKKVLRFLKTCLI